MPVPSLSDPAGANLLEESMQKIQDFITSCVKFYQHSELQNFNRDITEDKARKELLSRGMLFCFEKDTYIPAEWFKEKTCCNYLPNPIQADDFGKFQDSFPFDGAFRLKLTDSNGLIIGMRDF